MSGRGMSQKNLALIEAMFKILEAIQPATVRGVCYQIFIAMLMESMSDKNVHNVGRLLVKAREAGTIPWGWIVDETRGAESVSTWNSLGDFGEDVVEAYRGDFWKHQDAWIKVFSEKSTVGGVVRPVLREFAVEFNVMHGYGSATKLHQIAKESLVGDRTLEILYIGDFDPSGMHMSEVDLPGRIERYGGKVKITRIALRRGDCFDLPSFDAATKTKDPRHAWFKRTYGDTCWELDAMNPNDLRDRLRGKILARIDIKAWEHCQKTEKAERESLNSWVKAWPKADAAE